MKWQTILWLWAISLFGQQTPSLPYQPALITDQKGHDWFIEASGALQRSSGSPTMIGNALTLHVGNQQFYGQSALSSPDGSSLMMASPQPMNGLKITRWLTLLNREGVLLTVEELQNTTQRDLTTNIEIRHGFNNAARAIHSNLGRVCQADLEANESGLICLPDDATGQTPALLLMMRVPGSPTAMRVAVKGNYQLSTSYALTIPAGQTQTLIHGTSQVKISAKATEPELAKIGQSYNLKKLAQSLPSNLVKQAVNLRSQAGVKTLEDWFPKAFWDIPATQSDQLALGPDSLLQGKAGASRVTLRRGSQAVPVAWDRLSAMAGPLLTGDDTGWLWLRDGQRWRGVLQTPDLHLTLISGSKVPVNKLDRLVLQASSSSGQVTQTLIELKNGERLAVKPEGPFQADLEFGKLDVPWSEILLLQGVAASEPSGLIYLQDGSRLRVRLPKTELSLSTLDLGVQKIDLRDLRQIVTPSSGKAAAMQDQEPTTAYLELDQDQRLIARLTDATITLNTLADPITLPATSLRELSLESEASEITAPRFRATLWAGGHVTGTLQTPHLTAEGPGFRGQIPVSMIQRLVNPIPITDSALMSQIGQWLKNLGHRDWKVREAAMTSLRELGLVAKSSLREALKTSTDAEVTRRLEELLQDLE